MIVKVLRAHAKVDKVVRRGAKAIASIASGRSESSEVMVARGARAVLEVIAADPDLSVKARTAVRAALDLLS